jgi:RND superfamily putative drug exporter
MRRQRPAGAAEDGGGTGFLARLGRGCARHPIRVIAAWLVVLVAVAVASQAARPTYSDAVRLHTQGYTGLHLLHTSDPGLSAYAGRVVFHDPSGPVSADPATIAAVDADIAQLPHVVAVSDPLAKVGGALSADRRTAYTVVQFDVIPKTLGPEFVTELDQAVFPLRQLGMQVDYGGDLDLLTQPGLSDGRSEAIGLGVALLVLLIGFGSVAAALLPLLSALISIGIGLSLLGVVATTLTFATASPTLAVMIGLGVAIDYALFLTTRFRQLVADGSDPAVAAGMTVATSGHAVVVAATTVSVAIFGLYSSGLTFIGKLGLAAVISVVVAAAAALTLVPAGLGLLGRRIDTVRVKRPVAESRSEHDGWHRYALLVGRHPLVFLVAGVSLLGVLAIPMFSMRLGHVDDGADPASYTDKQAYDLVASAFGPGANGPFTVVVDLADLPPVSRDARAADAMIVTERNPLSPAVTALSRTVRATLRSTPGVAVVTPLVPTEDGQLLVGSVQPATGPQAPATTALFHRLVGRVLPGVFATRPGVGYVTGPLALQIEFVGQVNRGLPIIIAVVVAAAFVLLLLTFRGLLLALKAAVLNLLSIGASYGVVVAVFQWGWGRSLLGVSENVPIESYVPMMMFAIVFGLSLDYEVFLLSRVKEVWDVTGDHPQAVARGLASTARVITCAALIMASVFAAFVTSSSVVIKMIALGLACSIVIDATVVRLLLVPAIMNLLGGSSSWWIPRWLDRVLPRLGGTQPAPAGRLVRPDMTSGVPTGVHP